MIPSRSSERSASSFCRTADTVVAFGRGALGTLDRFVVLVLTVSCSEVTLLLNQATVHFFYGKE